MAKKALILGPSGAGKSHSLKYLDPGISFIINPDKKELPWRGSEDIYVAKFKKALKPEIKNDTWISVNTNYCETRSMTEIGQVIQNIALYNPKIINISIDTISHAMNKSVMANVNVSGYDKFNQFAEEFYILNEIIDNLPAHMFVSVHAHTEIEDSGKESKVIRFQVPAGKLTRKLVDPESLFTTVLYAQTRIVDGKPIHYFLTQTDGINTAKSPEGMFPLTIENNMQKVRDRMFAYYSKGELPEMKELLDTTSF